MRKKSMWLGLGLCAVGLLAAIADAAQTGRLTFLSTQLRPIEEAQKMRTVILKDFPRKVEYVTEQPAQLPVRIKAEQQGGTHTIDLVGALHGELQPLVGLDALGPLDDLAIHFEDQPHDAVRRRMLRPEIHHVVLDVRRPFELVRQ